MDESKPFSLDYYESLINQLIDKGYQITDFEELQPQKRQLILRHDIDMSIEAAVAMAERENSIGVASTYFVLLRTEFYNIFSRRSTNQLQCILSLGHKIGLHFDASPGSESKSELINSVIHECEVLASHLGNAIRVFSLHRPISGMIQNGFKVKGRINTYDPRFFDDIGYCSDSRGDWYHGHPLEHPAIMNGTALQLLTHPIWWNAKGAESVRDILDRFLLRRFDRLRAELAANCEAYPQSFLNSESDD